VDVILVEPGLITTGFGRTAAAWVDQTGEWGPYAKFNRRVAKLTEGVYGGAAELSRGWTRGGRRHSRRCAEGRPGRRPAIR
jgi:hypothetical protein